MDETDTVKKKERDESRTTNDGSKVTLHETSNDKVTNDGEKNREKSLGGGSDRFTLKRPLQDVKGEEDKSFSSLEDNERDDGNAGIPSTDTSAMAHGASSDVGDNEQMKLEERRAYNRRNAARSRQRVKDQLRDLQQQVIAHTTSRSELERTNVRLLAENNVLRDEVHKLRTILSGAPLFGQQSQALQPFLQQQMPMALNPTAQYATQLVAQQPTATARQIPQIAQPTQMSLPNSMPQQLTNQSQLGFFPPTSTQTKIQQEPSSSVPSFPFNQQQFASTAGDDNSQQNAIVQLLLQQIMNNNNNTAPTTQLVNNTTNEQQQATLQQQSQLQAQPQQQNDNAYASFMSFVGGGAGATMIQSNDDSSGARSQPQILTSSSTSATDAQPSSTTIFQNSYPLVHPQQFDQMNFQDMQQSFHMQQQLSQQQELSYDQKLDIDDNKNNEPTSKKYNSSDDNRYEDTMGV